MLIKDRSVAQGATLVVLHKSAPPGELLAVNTVKISEEIQENLSGEGGNGVGSMGDR
jgi:hypothetical protein